MRRYFTYTPATCWRPAPCSNRRVTKRQRRRKALDLACRPRPRSKTACVWVEGGAGWGGSRRTAAVKDSGRPTLCSKSQSAPWANALLACWKLPLGPSYSGHRPRAHHQLGSPGPGRGPGGLFSCWLPSSQTLIATEGLRLQPPTHKAFSFRRFLLEALRLIRFTYDL